MKNRKGIQARKAASQKALRARWDAQKDRGNVTVAAKLGISKMSLWRYENGRTPWPIGMQAKYERIKSEQAVKS